MAISFEPSMTSKKSEKHLQGNQKDNFYCFFIESNDRMYGITKTVKLHIAYL